MHILYNISIFIYLYAIRIASLFNPKARLWISGRKNIFTELQSRFQSLKSDVVWIHCASLGEFEQGRPLIEKIKQNYPQSKILLTFFSPSGYEIRKNYSGADFVFYLPLDTPANVFRFLDIVKPKTALFVKYEFWFNYLTELKKRDIPTYLISGIFRKEQHFFKGYGTWFRKQLSCFSGFYVQDQHSAELLESIGYVNVVVAGDTRFDRVSEIAKNIKPISVIEQFRENKSLIILGSSWPEDEELLLEWLNLSDFKSSGFKIVIAPHEVNESRIQSVTKKFSGFPVIKFSKADAGNAKNAQILVIDNIGMLSSVYNYGTIAFIGGGFGKGIHNILEAAAFGLPVIIGPNYHKFNEAKELIKTGGAFSVADKNEFDKTVSLLKDEQVLKTASHISRHYVQSRVGATEKILNGIRIK